MNPVENSSPQLLGAVQRAISRVADSVGPRVVGVSSAKRRASGFVVEPGLVLTSAYLAKASKLKIHGSGSEQTAEVKATDPRYGICLLAADTGDVDAPGWSAAKVEIGQPLVCLANPRGRALRATLGFVSATDRSFRGPGGRRIEDAFEHTAPLVSGSAGGPVCDIDGRVVAVNALRLDGGFALAVSAGTDLTERLAQLARGDVAPASPRLGVAVAGSNAARRMRQAVGLSDRSGLLVRAVEPQSAAEAASIAAGDLIVAANDRPVSQIDDLHRALDESAGGPLTLSLLRGDTERTASVVFDSETGDGDPS